MELRSKSSDLLLRQLSKPPRDPLDMESKVSQSAYEWIDRHAELLTEILPKLRGNMLISRELLG